MFEKTKKWKVTSICGGIFFIVIASTCLVDTIKMILKIKDRYGELIIEDLDLFFLFVWLIFLGIGIVNILFGRYIVKESRPFDYTLKEPLEIKINRGYKPYMNTGQDINGLKIENNGDSEKMVDYINFKRGDTIKIKIIEEYNVHDESNWRNARVYVFLKDELVEIPYEETTKQGIDKLLMSIYKYK